MTAQRYQRKTNLVLRVAESRNSKGFVGHAFERAHALFNWKTDINQNFPGSLVFRLLAKGNEDTVYEGS